MKLKIIIFIVIILPLNLAVQAQDDIKTNTSKEIQQKLTAKDYENLVTKLKGGDTNIDFRKIRLAYAETKDFSGYGGSESRKAMNVALDKKDYKAALKVIEERLKINYVDIDAHFTAFQAYKELDKKKEADFHRTIARGLIDSILENADGKTAKTAFFVISTREEYIIMSYYGFRVGSQSLAREDGHTFDVLSGTNPDTKESVKMYFNIDKVFGKF